MKKLLYLLPLFGSLLFFTQSCSTDNTPVYQLSTLAEPSEAGTVSQSDRQVDQGKAITITANPNEHWVFDRWSGDYTGTDNPVAILMDTDKAVIAFFVKRDYPLTINIVGEGSVKEDVIQARTTDYPHGTMVQLTAQPAEGWEFAHWSGDSESLEPVIEVTVAGQVSITATFERLDYPLTVTIKGEGEVEQQVISTPKTTDYLFETVVELTAIAAEGWVFNRWEGDLQSSENPQEITITEGKNVSAIFKLDFNEVTNPATGRTWMDRNLGASQPATSMTDEQAYGDLYQWGRGADGHQLRTSPTTTTLSNNDKPDHGSFILAPNEPFDWRSPQNANLWQGVNGVNNPCPDGFRLPTEAEWEAERLSWSSDDAAGAFNSPLKLPLAGGRNPTGSFGGVGSRGGYWSLTAPGSSALFLVFVSSDAGMGGASRSWGFSVRCIKD